MNIDYTKNQIAYLHKLGYAIMTQRSQRIRTLTNSVLLVAVVLLSLVIGMGSWNYVNTVRNAKTVNMANHEFTDTLQVQINYLRGMVELKIEDALKTPTEEPKTETVVKYIFENERNFVITGYSLNDPIIQGTGEVSAMGDNVWEYPWRIVAVDPSVIPLNSIVIITMSDGNQIAAIARDTGGMIKGDRIDLVFQEKVAAQIFGTQTLKVRWFPPRL